MPKITITEIDETKPGVSSESTDVVYIPGFVNLDQTCLYDNDEKSPTYGEYIGLEVNTPTLFTSVAQFEALCGTEPAVFNNVQRYSSLYYFEPSAIPHDDVMFKSGDVDPAYVWAKELLTSGLPVLYERINSPATGYVALKSKPEDFETNYTNYYFYSSKSTYQPASLAYLYPNSVPEWREESYTHLGDDEEFEGDNYVIQKDLDDRNVTWEEYYKQCYTLSPVRAGEYNQFLNPFREPEDGVYYTYTTNDDLVSISTMYNALEEVFDSSNEFGIVDRGNYSVKYLTSGGYPVFEYSSDPDSTNTIVTKMLKMAEKRGDCVALIDHTDYINRELNPNKAGSLYKAVADAETVWGNGDFGAMFTPWAIYNRISSDTLESKAKGTSAFRAPASFAYLTSLADSIKTNANWLAIAGVTRGKVLNVGNMTNKIPNTVADAMQPRTGMSINAITNIKPYGQTIWGNRTLKNNAENLVATSFLNIRNLVSDVKKSCYKAARSITFEQDTEVLWVNFKSLISPLLDRMVSGYGISGYKIVRDVTHPKAKEKATVCARIILYPTYAVEDFYITVVLKDAEVTVE